MDKNINFLIFGRFPTERAYGVHVVSNAKSYQNFGKEVLKIFWKVLKIKRINL